MARWKYRKPEPSTQRGFFISYFLNFLPLVATASLMAESGP
jgi:hypothetical protein